MALECREFKFPDSKLCFLWLHGYGANMDDLAPLKDVIETPEQCDWYFLNGPISIPISFFMEGRAWFPLDLEKYQRENVSTAEVFEKSLPPGYLEAVEKVEDFIEDNLSNYDEIYIGGFSQGSMLASRIAIKNPKIKNLVLFSTTYFDGPGWESIEIKNPNLNCFQSHGENDIVLPASASRKMGKFLKEKLANHYAIEFPGGHEIPPVVIQQLNLKLNEWGKNEG